ncbi:MAG: uncharacterized protein JWM74_2148, partial [Myxococcaceae bacterium]|nr:uncharacterized protein [Myxococcaceae bacterium]
MRLFPRTCVAISFTLAASLGGCGHLAFEDLPVEESEGGIDAGIDASIDAPLVEASADTGPRDAAVDAADGGCAGPSCVGTFVSGNTGLDTNPGTATAPVKTITKAIAIAVGLGGRRSVFVAASHYPEKVTLAEGVDLLGGYDCDVGSCTWARNVLVNDSAILDPDFEGVLAPKTITRQTLFDGFRVMGKGGAPTSAPGSAAITLEGGSPTISRCKIVGGDTNGGATVSAKRSIAIAVLAPSNSPTGALIDRNNIVAGGSTDTSVGVLFDSKVGTSLGPAAALVTGNVIHGGTAPSTHGVLAFASGSGAVVQGNDIIAGTSTTSGNPGSSWGITVAAGMVIDGNRINVDQLGVGTCSSNSNFCGGVQSLGSVSSITNNVILGVKGPRSCAVLLTEAEQAAGVVVLNANTLDGAGSGVAGGGGSISTAIAIRIGNCGSCGTNAVIGKARNNILLGGTNQSRYGVYEDGISGKTSHLAALDNNDFWNATAAARNDFAYRFWDGSSAQDLTFAEITSAPDGGLTTPVPNADLNVDPLLDATYHLTGASPCANKGTAVEAPARDIDGENRPKG